MKFTNTSIKALKPKDKRYVVYETAGKGLGVRVEPSGRITFFLEYRFDGKNRIYTIGKYPTKSLAGARTEATKARDKVGQGIDPGKQKIQEKIAHRESYTVFDLSEEFIEKWSKPRKKTWREDERCLHKEVIPLIGKKKAREIRRRDIILILDQIVDRGSPGMANRTLNVISKMFNFAVSRDILDTSPSVAIAMPAEKKERDRVLDEPEIKKFWNELEKSKMSISNILALKLMLSTAQRRGEVVSAEWKELDLKKGWWDIPPERTKNGIRHRVPLNNLAKKILKEIRKNSKKSGFLFPSTRRDGPIDSRATTKALRKIQKDIGLEHFTPHDLRRTAATMMTALGFQRLIVSKILNHSESGTTKIYDRYTYDDEKKKALEAWGRKLELIINEKKAKK